MKWPECSTCIFYEPNQVEVEQRDDAKYICNNPEVGGRFRVTFGCALHMGADATEMNVPNHTPNGSMTDPNPNPMDGPTEIFIATYWKDLPWLELALMCIQRHCTGFQGITIATPNPNPDGKWISPVWFDDMQARGNIRITARYYDEVPGKGMVQHMVKMAEADQIVPAGTKYVLHMDGDCMFRMPTTPEHYFWKDKPYYLIRSWSSLGVSDPRHPISKTVSDCGQWKNATDIQLGWDTEWYTMCMNTAALPIEFYKPYREHIAQVHKRPFDDHMLAGRNEWPQSSMDWTSMGAFAHRFMRERFTWFDVCDGTPYPVDRKKAYWSHGGISDEIRAEIESFLK